MILGQHLQALGEDSREELNLAIEAFEEEERRLSHSNPGVSLTKAEAQLYRSVSEVLAGQDPKEWMKKTDALLARWESEKRGLNMGDRMFLPLLRGQLEWLVVRWNLAQGRGPGDRFGASLAALQKASALDIGGRAESWIARVRLDRACLPGGDPRDLDLGAAAAQRAIQQNPKAGEAYLALGEIRLAQAERTTGTRREAWKTEGLALVGKALECNANLRLRATGAGTAGATAPNRNLVF